MKTLSESYFTPQLILKFVLPAIEFYKKAYGAVELRRWSNPDGSVHVAEMEINGAMFHLHEESSKPRQLSPETLHAVTSVLGLFVSDPHEIVKNAEVAGGHVVSQVQDYDYGYRQGMVVDPFGHHWLIQKKI